MDLESARFQEAKEKANHPTVTIGLLVGLGLNVAMLAVGCVKKHECPADDRIPIFLIVAGAIGIASKILPLLNRKLDWCLIHLAVSLLFLFEIIWIIVGSVWVYGTKVNYDPNAINYCSKSAYLLSFWLLTIYWVFLALGIVLACCCCCFFKGNSS